LHNIPFESLKVNNRFLIESTEINYAYSISFLEENKAKIRQNENDFIGFAPINFNNNVSSLPKTETEIKEASRLFDANVYLYKNATKNQFKTQIKGHKIVHIASHANVTDNISPSIIFNDDKLILEELYLVNNTADLVVLSACNTSIGELKKGEGAMSLARGFFNTGANSVIATQWKVNDKTSSKIITQFYKNIKKGKTKSQALREAKLNYLKTHQLSELSPYYWASFVLIGDDSSIDLNNNNILFYIIQLLVILLFLFFISKKIKNRG